MTVSAPVNIRAYHRDTFTVTIEDLPPQWDGWTFAGQIREYRDDDSFLIATFNVDAARIVADKEVVFAINAATMQALPVDTLWWFDLRAKLAGVEHTFIAATLSLTENVTVI